MKLSEVIEALERNPKKRFECSLIGGHKGYMYTKDDYYRLDIHDDDGFLIYQQRGGGAFNDNIHINIDWQEVKQPVTWQEALEAWVNGKRVICKLNEETYAYHISCLLLVDQDANALSDSEIQRGTWYIED